MRLSLQQGFTIKLNYVSRNPGIKINGQETKFL